MVLEGSVSEGGRGGSSRVQGEGEGDAAGAGAGTTSPLRQRRRLGDKQPPQPPLQPHQRRRLGDKPPPPPPQQQEQGSTQRRHLGGPQEAAMAPGAGGEPGDEVVVLQPLAAAPAAGGETQGGEHDPGSRIQGGHDSGSRIQGEGQVPAQGGEQEQGAGGVGSAAAAAPHEGWPQQQQQQASPSSSLHSSPSCAPHPMSASLREMLRPPAPPTSWRQASRDLGSGSGSVPDFRIQDPAWIQRDGSVTLDPGFLPDLGSGVGAAPATAIDPATAERRYRQMLLEGALAATAAGSGGARRPPLPGPPLQLPGQAALGGGAALQPPSAFLVPESDLASRVAGGGLWQRQRPAEPQLLMRAPVQRLTTEGACMHAWGFRGSGTWLVNISVRSFGFWVGWDLVYVLASGCGAVCKCVVCPPPVRV